MSDNKVAKPVAVAVGLALAGSFGIGGVASADTGASPFEMTSLSAGYMLGAGEGNCGGDKGDKDKADHLEETPAGAAAPHERAAIIMIQSPSSRARRSILVVCCIAVNDLAEFFVGPPDCPSYVGSLPQLHPLSQRGNQARRSAVCR